MSQAMMVREASSHVPLCGKKHQCKQNWAFCIPSGSLLSFMWYDSTIISWPTR